jgi:hypothetical protein
MNLPVRYRLRGEDGWSYGITINISSSGLLFWSDREVEPPAEVEIEVVLPGDEAAGARVVSHGGVIRVGADPQSRGDRVIAATLDNSSLVREARPSA